jgi:hypothetical protein
VPKRIEIVGERDRSRRVWMEIPSMHERGTVETPASKTENVLLCLQA